MERKNWDNLSFEDLLKLYQPLKVISNDLLLNYGKDIEHHWRLSLFKRMQRENLISRNMRL